MNADDKNSVEYKVGQILRVNGWFHNEGWRREADTRNHTTMPPPLSMGQAVDETIGLERRVHHEHGN